MTGAKGYNSAFKMLIKKYGAKLAVRDRNANKGTYGKLLIIAGSRGMAGAAFLNGLAAYRMGTGMVKYFGTEDNRIILQTLLPEAMYESWEHEEVSRHKKETAHEKCEDCEANLKNAQKCPAEYIDIDKLKENLDWADYVIIGPGLSKSRAAREIIRLIFKPEITERLHEKRLVILDADALNIIADEGLNLSLFGCKRQNEPEYHDENNATEQKLTVSNVVITPHAAEMARLIKSVADKAGGELASFTDIASIKKSPETAARLYGRLHGINVILKNAETVIYLSNGRTLVSDSGCAAMAKAGSGDVLCGFVAGTAAILNEGIADALPMAVFMHGMAGSIAAGKKGVHSILARDIAEAAGKAIIKTYSS